MAPTTQFNVRILPEHKAVLAQVAARLKSEPGFAEALAHYLSATPVLEPLSAPLPDVMERLEAMDRRRADDAAILSDSIAAINAIVSSLSDRVARLEARPPVLGTATLPPTAARTPAVPPPSPVVPAAGENPAPLAQMDIEDVIGGKGHATAPTQKRQPPGGIHPASDALAAALLAMNKAGKSWQAIANEVRAKTGFKGSDQTFNAWGKGRRPVTIHGGRVLISTFPELAAAAHPTEMESDE